MQQRQWHRINHNLIVTWEKHISKNYRIRLIKEQSIPNHIKYSNVKKHWTNVISLVFLIHLLMNELHKNLKAQLCFIRTYNWFVVSLKLSKYKWKFWYRGIKRLCIIDDIMWSETHRNKWSCVSFSFLATNMQEKLIPHIWNSKQTPINAVCMMQQVCLLFLY